MGLHEKLRKFKRSSSSNGIEMQRRRSSQNLVVPPGQVTENSLQVWRALPPQIRHDPSMVSFQMENERLRGKSRKPQQQQQRKSLRDFRYLLKVIKCRVEDNESTMRFCGNNMVDVHYEWWMAWSGGPQQKYAEDVDEICFRSMITERMLKMSMF